MSASDLHTCGVKNDGTVACWGDDRRGQASPLGCVPALVRLGQPFTCDIVIGNLTGNPLTGATLVMSSGVGQSCIDSPGTRRAVCTLGKLAPGQGVTVRLSQRFTIGLLPPQLCFNLTLSAGTAAPYMPTRRVCVAATM